MHDMSLVKEAIIREILNTAVPVFTKCKQSSGCRENQSEKTNPLSDASGIILYQRGEMVTIISIAPQLASSTSASW